VIDRLSWALTLVLPRRVPIEQREEIKQHVVRVLETVL
jgi:hypothetical protein